MPNFLKASHQHRKRSTYAQNKLYSTKRWRKYRMALISKQGGKCVECGDTPESHKLHIDHIKPLADGGEPYDEQNLQILCVICHGKKTAKEMGWGSISNAAPDQTLSALRVFLPNDQDTPI